MKHSFLNIKQYDAGAEGAGGADKSKADILKELGNIKAALEKKLNDDATKTEKNLTEKIEAYAAEIEELKAKVDQPTVTVEEFKTALNRMQVTEKAFDLLQTSVKKSNQQSFGNQQEDQSMGGQIAKAVFGKKNEIMSAKIIGKTIKDQDMTIKAAGDMTVIGNVNTGVVPNTYRQGIVPPPYENIHLRNLVTVTPSETDSYHFYRFVQGEGNITFQGNEAGAKPQIDEDLTEQVVNLDYLAGWLKISRKMLRNFTGLQAFLSRWLPEQYYQTEDTKGYQALIASATGVQDTSGTDMMSVIIRTIGKQKKAKYNVNGIVVDGEVWARLLTYKASGSGEFTMPMGVVTISPTGQLLLVGIPVYTASWVGGDEAIVGDWRYFEIIQSESMSVGFFEQDDKNVQQNKITVRIEASVGFANLDPKAFVVVALESVS